MSRTLPALFALLTGAALTGSALAQDGAPAEGAATAAPNLSAARASLAEIREHRDHVTKLQKSADGGDDEALTACLASRANQLTTLAEVSEGILTDFTTALGEGEDGRAAAEGRKLSVAATKARGLRAEADACGEGGGTTTEPIVVEDPYKGEQETVEVQNEGIGDDPPGASPFE
ncbi:MAG: hypothetical protein H6741_09020 [Alphaproteobacteria bacterium]|nr:hypothetical protein [Alphaproteobacteria bacterium]